MTETNLRTRLHRIIRDAGLEPWPKSFVALRSTRRKELEDQFPSHEVNAWMGHVQPSAAEHYLQVTEAHFATATGEAQHQAQQQATLQEGTDRQGAEQSTANSDEGENTRDPVVSEVGATGLEPVTFS